MSLWDEGRLGADRKQILTSSLHLPCSSPREARMSAFQRGRIPVLFSLRLETYFGNERYISACTYVYIFTYTPTRILHVRYVHKMYLCVLAGKVITFGKGVGEG